VARLDRRIDHKFCACRRPASEHGCLQLRQAGLEALTRTLALERRDAGVRVNAIAPGLVDTGSNIAAMKPKDLKHWTKLFLALSAAAGVTGRSDLIHCMRESVWLVVMREGTR
jgi:enoyl-[acyl-carrier-protein] reductase (NADH)